MKTKRSTAVVVIAILAIVPAAALRGWVLKVLWDWFVVPLGVPALGIVNALGLATLVGMLTHEMAGTQAMKYDDDPNVNLLSHVIIAFAQPLLVLAFCACIRWLSS